MTSRMLIGRECVHSCIAIHCNHMTCSVLYEYYLVFDLATARLKYTFIPLPNSKVYQPFSSV